MPNSYAENHRNHPYACSCQCFSCRNNQNNLSTSSDQNTQKTQQIGNSDSQIFRQSDTLSSPSGLSSNLSRTATLTQTFTPTPTPTTLYYILISRSGSIFFLNSSSTVLSVCKITWVFASSLPEVLIVPKIPSLSQNRKTLKFCSSKINTTNIKFQISNFQLFSSR